MSLKKNRLAIFGGSFSPIHIGHLKSARAYLEESGAEKITVIPAKRPPHKTLDCGASDTDRINMCNLAFSSDELLRRKYEVSDFELSRDSVSYTIDTVDHFISQGYEDISILIGTDMLLTFESWRGYRELLSKVTVYYTDRYTGDEKAKSAIAADMLRQKYNARVFLLDIPVFEVSSSEIRELIKKGESTDGILCPEVREYIDRMGLYR